MIVKAKQALVRFQHRWQFLLVLKYVLYALGPAIFTFVLSSNFYISLSIFVFGIGAQLAYHKPWNLSLNSVSAYVDEKLSAVAFSSGLLLKTIDLSGLAQVQQQRVAEVLLTKIGTIRPKIGFLKPVFTLFTFILLSVVAYQFGFSQVFSTEPCLAPIVNKISFKPIDSSSVESIPPILESQKIIISYPAYTNTAPFSSSSMEIKALEGSQVRWNLEFDQKVDRVSIEFSGTRFPMKLQSSTYSFFKKVDNAEFYNFRFKDTLGAAYISDLHSVEIIRDQPPVISLNGLQPFVSFTFDQKKQLDFSAVLTDDFGIGSAYINATVSRGTGESVKFREEQIGFANPGKPGEKMWNIEKKINLDSLKMEPGDELYFYVETSDLKTPKPNISRSETFFAVIKDTVSYEFAVEGTLGVDRMPDCFRSQRQLIIDTEKLIKSRSNLSEAEFNKKSNELGAEQSALRLKYGKFMGDENTGAEDHDHDGTENPLADYMHDHDGSNEHNLVENDGEQAKKDTTSTGKPDQFTQSLHSKMREALNEMWSSERHLRINEPSQSLPYQNRALNLLQEIKNSARIYVHRTGFDPPPIKENARLTGDIKEVDNYRKTENLENPETEENIRKSVVLIEQILTQNSPISDDNKSVFNKAGSELAQKAIENPGKYLSLLQQLKWVGEREEKPDEEKLRTLQSGLLQALNNPNVAPKGGKGSISRLNLLVLKELQQND
ncbi:hypothetical protein [Flavimarina sp. Hel_I_48]|uniref:hypothetical protein n=1 Tax=Flavimarina sp. Hel_I_48 TaxID=1392488 RepID=UPI0004DF83C0|nr:hypothetical protein [Flavimarina sp. Hel_I_48]